MHRLIQLIDDLGMKLELAGDSKVMSAHSLVLVVRKINGTNFPPTSVDIFNTDNVQVTQRGIKAANDQCKMAATLAFIVVQWVGVQTRRPSLFLSVSSHWVVLLLFKECEGCDIFHFSLLSFDFDQFNLIFSTTTLNQTMKIMALRTIPYLDAIIKQSSLGLLLLLPMYEDA